MQTKKEPIIYWENNNRIKNYDEFNVASILLFNEVKRCFKEKCDLDKNILDKVLLHMRRALHFDSENSVLNWMKWLLNKYIKMFDEK